MNWADYGDNQAARRHIQSRTLVRVLRSLADLRRTTTYAVEIVKHFEDAVGIVLLGGSREGDLYSARKIQSLLAHLWQNDITFVKFSGRGVSL